MVEISRSPELLQQPIEGGERRRGQRSRLPPTLRQVTAERGAPLVQVLQLRTAVGKRDERHLGDLVVRHRDVEAVAELLQRVLRHLLRLVADHLAFARFAHPVALHGLGEDDRRLPLVLHGRRIRGVDLERIVTAATQLPHLLVGEVGDQRLQFRRVEEVLAHVRAVLALEVLVLAVDALFHPLQQDACLVLREQLVPAGAPDHLDHVPAGAAKHAFELLDDLAVAAHRPVEPLQVAVDDEDQVVEPLAPAERDRAERFRLVALAVAEERPHLAVVGLGEAAAFQILEEARLIDRHQRSETHRHRRELPEVRHQPRMRIRRDALAFALLAVAEELLLGQASFDERARIDAGRNVTLHVDQVAAVSVRRRMPEMPEADVVEQRRRLEARDVAAELGRLLVRAQDDRHGVPADRRADLVLELAIAGRLRLLLGRDRVPVRRGRQERRHRAGTQRLVAQHAEQIPGSLGSRMLQNRAQRVDPFLGLDGIVIVQDSHGRPPCLRLHAESTRPPKLVRVIAINPTASLARERVLRDAGSSAD